MAMLLNLQFKGLSINDAYVRVVMPTINAAKNQVSFGLHYHVAPGEEAIHAESREAPYTLAGGNPFEQAYVFLMAQEEFADATAA
jgi:hypothetical protein